MSRCLYCYQELGEGETDFHPQCGKKIFGSKTVPLLPYTKADIKQLAEQVIRSQTTLTGVQAKLSLDISSSPNQPQRFTIVGLWGRYILKPQTEQFKYMPEVEDLTMHLAELAKVNVVPHSLIRFADGELAYITKRIDRTAKGEKLPMEDMCQLSERLTEYKYKGSYEKIAKIIMQYSSVPKLDVINFWEQVVFSWLTGNADMHLKNFSLYSQRKGYYSMPPGYDMLSTALLMPEDTEAGQIQGFLEHYTGNMVCSKQLFKEALGHTYDEPKRWQLHNINEIMNTVVTGWKPFSNSRMFTGYGRQRGWERDVSGNELPGNEDGFVELTEEECCQLELPKEWIA